MSASPGPHVARLCTAVRPSCAVALLCAPLARAGQVLAALNSAPLCTSLCNTRGVQSGAGRSKHRERCAEGTGVQAQGRLHRSRPCASLRPSARLHFSAPLSAGTLVGDRLIPPVLPDNYAPQVPIAVAISVHSVRRSEDRGHGRLHRREPQAHRISPLPRVHEASRLATVRRSAHLTAVRTEHRASTLASSLCPAEHRTPSAPQWHGSGTNALAGFGRHGTFASALRARSDSTCAGRNPSNARRGVHELFPKVPTSNHETRYPTSRERARAQSRALGLESSVSGHSTHAPRWAVVPFVRPPRLHPRRDATLGTPQ